MPAATSEEIVSLSATSVVVHPLVLLSVVDHQARAARGTKRRVVGILLGQNDGKKINVANSFAGELLLSLAISLLLLLLLRLAAPWNETHPEDSSSIPSVHG